MKKVLKKSFEDFVKGYESFGEKVILTGNLYDDLKKYFASMVYGGVFYMLPKKHAFRVSEDKLYHLKSLEINLLNNYNSIMFSEGCVRVCENGNIYEYLSNDENDIKMQRMQRFILPMRELIKQMQQYYIDHNLVEKK